jgi:single-strand DNA-binding protein
MANFNKVILLGNLTRDPQLRYLPSQTAVVEFGLAMNRKWTGQDGSAKEEACFVDCQAFGKPAETLNKYCKKGNQLFVEGRLTFDSWTNQEGKKMSKLRVTVENFQFVGGPKEGSGQRSSTSAPPGGGEESSQDYGQPAPNDDIPF